MVKQILYLGLNPAHYIADGQITHWPIIQIVPRAIQSVSEVLSQFSCYSHIIVTSKSTVPILHDYLFRLGISINLWQKKITIAVGKVTAMQLRECNIYPSHIASEETAEGVVKILEQLSFVESSHVFWPHSAQARMVIKDYLNSRNVKHTDCSLYDTLPNCESLPDLAHYDEIVFTSASTVSAFLSLFGSFPTNVNLVTIGPITSRFLALQKEKVSLPK